MFVLISRHKLQKGSNLPKFAPTQSSPSLPWRRGKWGKTWSLGSWPLQKIKSRATPPPGEARRHTKWPLTLANKLRQMLLSFSFLILPLLLLDYLLSYLIAISLPRPPFCKINWSEPPCLLCLMKLTLKPKDVGQFPYLFNCSFLGGQSGNVS